MGRNGNLEIKLEDFVMSGNLPPTLAPVGWLVAPLMIKKTLKRGEVRGEVSVENQGYKGIMIL